MSNCVDVVGEVTHIPAMVAHYTGAAQVFQLRYQTAFCIWGRNSRIEIELVTELDTWNVWCGVRSYDSPELKISTHRYKSLGPQNDNAH